MRTEPCAPCCRHVASTPRGSRRASSSSIITGSARPGRAIRSRWWGAERTGADATRCVRRDTTRTDGWRWCRTARGGELLLDADGGGPQWQATLFGAAQDAAQGRIWRSEQHWWERLDGRRRRTQGRRLEMAGWLTGVSPELEEREREQIATRLAVATMTVISGARRWGHSWQSRGAAIVAVLAALVCSATLGDRTGAAGAVSDLPRCCATWWLPRWRRWCCAGAPRERQYAMLPVPSASAWTVAGCTSACVPCNAGARPGRAATSPPWSRSNASAPPPRWR